MVGCNGLCVGAIVGLCPMLYGFCGSNEKLLVLVVLVL